MFGTRKLGRTSDQRKAMLRQMTTDLLEKGKIETTFYRAKEVQPVVEKMITLGKKGNLAAYRRAMGFVTKEDVVNKLFKEVAPKYADRNGGYTRVTPLRWLSLSWFDPTPAIFATNAPPSGKLRRGEFFKIKEEGPCPAM